MDTISIAIQGQKIARKENTNHQIKDLLQKVGSNFFLDQEKIYIEYKKPFASLQAFGGAWAKSLRRNRISLSVLCFRDVITFFREVH